MPCRNVLKYISNLEDLSDLAELIYSDGLGSSVREFQSNYTALANTEISHPTIELRQPSGSTSGENALLAGL